MAKATKICKNMFDKNLCTLHTHVAPRCCNSARKLPMYNFDGHVDELRAVRCKYKLPTVNTIRPNADCTKLNAKLVAQFIHAMVLCQFFALGEPTRQWNASMRRCTTCYLCMRALVNDSVASPTHAVGSVFYL